MRSRPDCKYGGVGRVGGVGPSETDHFDSFMFRGMCWSTCFEGCMGLCRVRVPQVVQFLSLSVSFSFVDDTRSVRRFVKGKCYSKLDWDSSFNSHRHIKVNFPSFLPDRTTECGH